MCWEGGIGYVLGGRDWVGVGYALGGSGVCGRIWGFREGGLKERNAHVLRGVGGQWPLVLRRIILFQFATLQSERMVLIKNPSLKKSFLLFVVENL